MPKLDCLNVAGLNLDAAVFLAEACQVAYQDYEPTGKKWAQDAGFANSMGYDLGNTQMFWAESETVCLLVFRGTSNPGQWIRDFRILPALHKWGLIHRGFKTGVAVVDVAIKNFTEVSKGKKQTWIAGHSLGGALAVLTAANLKEEGIIATTYTYGQPRMGYWNFADRFDVELTGQLFRFINQADIVARIPPGVLYKHSASPKRIVKPGILESAGETLPLIPAMPDVAYSVNGPALESGEGLPFNEIKLTDGDVPPATEREFLMLQLQLGAASDTYVEGASLEGSVDVEGLFRDHFIGNYVQLLTEIRDSSRK